MLPCPPCRSVVDAMSMIEPLSALLDAIGDEARSVKRFVAGAHRSCAPAETISRVAPRMDSFGITRVADVTGLDRVGIPVVMAYRPNSRSLAVSQGKGVTLDAARASGIMEAIELFHAEHVNLPLRYGSQRDVARTAATVDPSDLPLLAGTRFDEGQPILWLDSIDLVARESLCVPFDIVHANYTHPGPPAAGCFDASTNGLASGNTMAEAVCHGLCEVIERDAMSLWSQRPRESRDISQIDPATIDDPMVAELMNRFEAAGVACVLWTVVSDIGVPSFACGTWDRDTTETNATLGSGSHPNRAIAAIRAVTEAAQIRLTYISGARDDLSSEAYDQNGRLRRLQYVKSLVAPTDQPLADFRAVESFDSDNAVTDLRWLIAQVQSAGLNQILAVNLSQYPQDIPIARVIVPGMEGIDSHAEYVPGRRARALLNGA